MAYYQRLQKYKDTIDGTRNEIGDVSNLVPLPPDQSQNIYADKVKQMNDQLAENITAPFTTIGAADLARRGISNLPAVKQLKELYNQGGELKEKLGNILSDNQVQNFLEDPQEALKGVSDLTKAKVFQAINDVKQSAISKLGELNVPDVGDITQQLINKIPSSGDIASEIGKQATERATSSLTSRASSIYDSIFGAPEVQAKAQEIASLPSSATQTITDTKSQATDLNKVGADDDEQEFLDARDFNLLDPLEIKPELPDDVKELYELHNDNIDQLNRLSATNWNPDAGSGEQLDAFRTLRTRSLPDLPADSEAARLADISGEKSTVNGLQASIEKEAGEAGIGDLGLDALGDGTDEAIKAAGLAVGDAIPGFGTLADLATVGAIIGEAVESENDKQKLAKDEAAQQAREAAIQQDIVQQQSQLVGQARQENLQQQQENQILAQQRNTQNTVPVAQVARD